MSNRKKQMKVQYNLHDWTRYTLYAGADKHGSQPVQNRTTGLHLRQSGPSWTTAPPAAVPAQMTGTQPFTRQLRSLWSTLSLKAHPTAFWTHGKERPHPHQPQLQDRRSSYPVLGAILKSRSTENNSQILRESDRHHGETLSAKIGSQTCQCSHHASAIEKDFFINRRKLRMICGHAFRPLHYQWQRRSLPNFLQQAVDKACQFSERVVFMIPCREGVKKIVGIWNKNINRRHGNRKTINHALPRRENATKTKCGTIVEWY